MSKLLTQKSRLLFLFAGTLVMMVLMVNTGASLKTPATPAGILNLEFAHNAAKASIVVNAWSVLKPIDKIQAAKNNTFFDFIFLFFYSFLLYTICTLLAASFKGFLFIAGHIFAKCMLVAGLLDVLENAGMLITLHNYISDTCSLLTFIFSVTKWTIVLLALGYILIACSILLYKKMTNHG